MSDSSSDNIDPKLEALINKVDSILKGVQSSQFEVRGDERLFSVIRQKSQAELALYELKSMICDQLEVAKQQAENNQRSVELLEKQSYTIERLSQALETLLKQQGAL